MAGELGFSVPIPSGVGSPRSLFVFPRASPCIEALFTLTYSQGVQGMSLGNVVTTTITSFDPFSISRRQDVAGISSR